MNFEEAIAAHVDWKAKLRTYIKKADKSLDPNMVEKDNECKLGKWIYGDGGKYKSSQHYEALRQEHAKFHKCAANIIRKVDEGKLSEAENLIDAKSQYTEISINVVTKIRKMREEVEKRTP